MTRLVVLVALAACNQVYDLAATAPLPDAPPPLDEDEDSTPDAVDNCVGLFNDQHDADEDGRGDVCDNCPLVANQDQEDVGDVDTVGDLCDPHPQIPGDCLVLLDVLRDPDAFAQHWQVLSTDAPPDVVARPHAVEIVPAPGSIVSLLALDDAGALFSGKFDTQLRASFAVTTGALFAMSGIETATTGIGCGVEYTQVVRKILGAVHSATTAAYYESYGYLSAEPIDSQMLLRLTVPTQNDPSAYCRVDYGLAVAAATMTPSPQQLTVGGAPGVQVRVDTATLAAVALYQVRSSCGNPLYR